MTRPVTLRAAAAALLTTALLLASCTKPPAVELRSQLRTLIGADTAPVTMLNITDGLEARTIVDGTERIISTKNQSTDQLRRVKPGRSWGFARPLADWDLDGLVASLPAECVLRRSDTRVHALALAGSAAYVEAHCGDTTSARIGDHDVAPLREWWSRESLATLFDEVRLISGSSEVTGLSVEGAPGRQWLAFTVRHSGEQAETHVRRALGDLESYSPRIIGVGGVLEIPEGSDAVDLSEIGPAELEAVLRRIVAAGGRDLADVTRIEIQKADDSGHYGNTAVTARWGYGRH